MIRGVRAARWKRGASLVAVGALLTSLAGLASGGVAGAQPVVKVGSACPADQDALVQLAQNDYNTIGSNAFVNNDIVGDLHSMYNTADVVNAEAYYNTGYFGQGVDVALIDTGVAPVAGLNNGNVVHGPDLSLESQSPYAHADTYGHGTHLASIIAGRDDTNAASTSTHKPYSWNDPAQFTGIAPAARVVSLKVGDSTGAVDVTQMIAGIDWVVKHAHDAPSASNPKGFNIRVLNLSFGLNAGLYDTAKTDALSYAVEQAWKAGIAVVAAAGNAGTRVAKTDPPLASPAFNNDIIAVGSYDPVSGNVSGFSSGGTTARMPDFVAPGQSVMGLHVSGATADEEIIADCNTASAAGATWTSPVEGPNGRFVHGTGTSQSAAVVSGALALMISKQGSLSNNDVKSILRRSANPRVGGSSGTYVKGQGLIDLADAYSTGPAGLTSIPPTGGASLDAARAMDFLTDGTTTLHGNIDIFGNPVDLVGLQKAEAKGAAWTTKADGSEVWFTGGFALGTGFASDPIVGSAWASRVWANTPLSAVDWTSHSWRDHTWSGATWDSHSWRSHSWRSTSWTGQSWASHAWRDNAWS